MATPRNKDNTSFTRSDRAASGKAQLTHERIDADLKKFERDGGTIEKLGNTPALKNQG
ncbi:hypothetical protein [Stenotrophomonas sp. MMGLT7]|uniref:hypothetical protein n=1 Tax=Stenotrophomonas sp. MMGLT7 TaxID=2901227 RepID=UPI001E311229|nr:hypothetical protein [Stenotrophomonas sp. MMGLT7]MCD7097519.1 hypothetical protein [Stenotrophomonas sp. MMGLT7]